MEHFDITIGHVVAVLVSVAFSVWAWVIRKFGDQHIETLKEVARDLRTMSQDISEIKTRLAIVEFKQEESRRGIKD